VTALGLCRPYLLEVVAHASAAAAAEVAAAAVCEQGSNRSSVDGEVHFLGWRDAEVHSDRMGRYELGSRGGG